MSKTKQAYWCYSCKHVSHHDKCTVCKSDTVVIPAFIPHAFAAHANCAVCDMKLDQVRALHQQAYAYGCPGENPAKKATRSTMSLRGAVSIETQHQAYWCFTCSYAGLTAYCGICTSGMEVLPSVDRSKHNFAYGPCGYCGMEYQIYEAIKVKDWSRGCPGRDPSAPVTKTVLIDRDGKETITFKREDGVRPNKNLKQTPELKRLCTCSTTILLRHGCRCGGA